MVVAPSEMNVPVTESPLSPFGPAGPTAPRADRAGQGAEVLIDAVDDDDQVANRCRTVDAVPDRSAGSVGCVAASVMCAATVAGRTAGPIGPWMLPPLCQLVPSKKMKSPCS